MVSLKHTEGPTFVLTFCVLHLRSAKCCLELDYFQAESYSCQNRVEGSDSCMWFGCMSSRVQKA